MLSKSKSKSVVGIDVEAGSVAATEVRVNGSVEVSGHAVAPLDSGVFGEGELVQPEALGGALKELFAEHKLSHHVRLGIANQRVVVRTLHLPAIDDPKQLGAAIRFQAQEHIPMPLDQAVLDWQVIGRSTGPTGDPRADVVVVAARRDMLGAALEALRLAGLRPVGIDLSAFGMIRALAGVELGEDGGAATQLSYEERMAQQAALGENAAGVDGSGEQPGRAKLYCNLGDLINLAVAQGSSCLFTRISPHGIEGMAQKLSERRKLSLAHARQWLVHVGLQAPVEEIAGDPEIVTASREALEEGVPRLVEEMRMSLQYYGASEGAVAVDGVVACGHGTTIPGLVERLQGDLGYPFTIGRAPALAHLDPAAAARLTLSYGLALEK